MKSTKDRILDVALDLFAQYGYDAVSVAKLADAVGIKAPSLYKHYSSKKEIFDALINKVTEEYNNNSVFSISNSYNREAEYKLLAELSLEDIAVKVCEQLKVVTQNPVINKVNKLLTIEQFKNRELCELLEKRQFLNVYEYCKGFFSYLIKAGLLAEHNIDILTLQFISPVTVQFQRVWRNPSLLNEAQDSVKKHIILFFEMYERN